MYKKIPSLIVMLIASTPTLPMAPEAAIKIIVYANNQTLKEELEVTHPITKSTTLAALKSELNKRYHIEPFKGSSSMSIWISRYDELSKSRTSRCKCLYEHDDNESVEDIIKKYNSINFQFNYVVDHSNIQTNDFLPTQGL